MTRRGLLGSASRPGAASGLWPSGSCRARRSRPCPRSASRSRRCRPSSGSRPSTPSARTSAGRGYAMVEAIADGDANRQLEQVRSFIARRVDGIVVVPKDAKSIIPMIKAAERGRDPHRALQPAARPLRREVGRGGGRQPRHRPRHGRPPVRRSPARPGRSRRPPILIGDLGDVNAIGRRDGFDQAAAACADAMEVVARIPTEWNQEKALAGVDERAPGQPRPRPHLHLVRLHAPLASSRP